MVRTPKLINGMTESKITHAMLDYLANQKTLKVIAEETGVTVRTLENWVKFYNLKRRLPKNKRHRIVWRVNGQGELFPPSDTLSKK